MGVGAGLLGKAIRVPGACGFPGMILIALTGVGGITDVWTFGHKIRLLRIVRSRHASPRVPMSRSHCGDNVDESTY